MLDKNKLIQVGIDYNDGLNRFSNNAELYEKFLIKFKDDENYSLLGEAIDNGDIKNAFIYAHTLKGVVGNLSMIPLYDKLYPLVEELRANNICNAKKRYTEIQEIYNKIITALS